MDTNLGPLEIVAWLRGRAKQFGDMADTIEATFVSNGRAAIPKPNVRIGSFDTEATTGSIASLLGDGKARRPSQIASELEMDDGVIDIVLQRNENLFKRNERGWVTLK